ncbi:hypothetical protein TSMEX_000186 [Taenia solium]|eukprot:TsM_001050700 transcript=TsM_001050700 gene=TsM_001050700
MLLLRKDELEPRDATLVAAESGPDFDGFYPAPCRFWQTGGVKEVHVLWMEEPQVSRNRRAEIDVQLRHLPLSRVLQGSY